MGARPSSTDNPENTVCTSTICVEKTGNGLGVFFLCTVGDRLISVNSVSLEGVSHHTALEIIEHAPEDVTLVISQPKEGSRKGSPRFVKLVFL